MSVRKELENVVEIETYGYGDEGTLSPTFEEWELREVDDEGHTGPHPGAIAATSAPAIPGFEERLASETQRSFETGRERGRQEGRAAERECQLAASAKETAQRAEQLRHLMDSFTSQRDAWLERAEHEIVRLSLAVAARILRHEAQMDPLFLLGAVRVALGQLSSSTEARVRVPARDADLWREAIALLPGRTLRPKITADDDMRLGECMLETDLGSADLGVRAQLSEIDSGFFDRPESGSLAGVAGAERP